MTSIGGGRLEQRGGGEVNNVLGWSSRHEHNTHGVGVTSAWAPAGHNNDHITSLEELAVLAYGQRRGRTELVIELCMHATKSYYYADTDSPADLLSKYRR